MISIKKFIIPRTRSPKKVPEHSGSNPLYSQKNLNVTEKRYNMPGPGPRGPRGFTDKKIDSGSLKRLLKMLFSDYPAQMITVVICIITTSIIGVLPSVYIERITSYIEEGLTTGWDAAKAKIVKTVIIMIVFFAFGIIAVTTQGLIMARVTQGFLHKTRTRMFSAMQNLPIKYFDTHGHTEAADLPGHTPDNQLAAYSHRPDTHHDILQRGSHGCGYHRYFRNVPSYQNSRR